MRADSEDGRLPWGRSARLDRDRPFCYLHGVMRVQTILVMLCTTVALALPAPARATPRRTLAFLGIHADRRYDAQLPALEESFLDALSGDGYFTKVTGKSDISALLGYDRWRALSGCTDSTCLAEIAGALGVTYVGQAEIGRIGNVTLVNLKIIDVRQAEVVARAMRRIQSDSELPDAIAALGREVVEPLRSREARAGLIDLKPPLALAFVPFGVGQFANHAPVKGTAFLVGEVAAFTTFGVTLGMFESEKLPGSGGMFQGGAFRDTSKAQGLETAYLVSFWTGVALAAAGVVDAVIER